MKRARISIDSADPVCHPQHNLVDQPDQKWSSQVPPLDSNNFTRDWPIWRQEFLIYLSATQDEVAEQKKLAIFLNCLGRQGIALATSFFPQLKDFGAEAEQVTFDMVWSKFDDHCSSMEAESDGNAFVESYKFFESTKNWIYGENVHSSYSRLSSATEKCNFKCRVCQTSYAERIVRDQLVQVLLDEDIVPELLEMHNPNNKDIIAKYEEINTDQKIWAEILPYLSLCDVDMVAQMSPRLERIVNKHVKETPYGLQIEPCCLQKHSIHADKAFYEKYGSNKSLKLLSLGQSEANQVLQYFPDITRLSLCNMEILDGFNTFPAELMELFMSDSVIERHVIESWFAATVSSLSFVVMQNVKHSFPLQGKVGGLGKALTIDGFEHLVSVIIRGESLNFELHCPTGSLTIESKEIVHCKVGDIQTEYLYLAVPNPELFGHTISQLRSSLKTVELDNWIPSFHLHLTNCDSLENLIILSKVDSIFKPQIDQLKIKNVDVTYESFPVFEVEPNLMFDILNDDCLLEIISFLTVPQWMAFGEIHSRAEWVVTSYKYHRTAITFENFCDSEMSEEHFNDICVYPRRFAVDSSGFVEYLQKFKQLTALTMSSFTITKEMVDQLPGELEELCLGNSYGTDLDLSPYFARINSTLRVLELAYLPDNPQFLMELKELREIKIRVRASIDQLPLMLRQNRGLERVDIRIDTIKNGTYEETLDAIRTLSMVKDIRISFGHFPPKYEEIMLSLIREIGPKLTKLSVDIEPPQNGFICKELENVNELIVNVQRNLKEAIKDICALKSLRKLKIEQYYYVMFFRNRDRVTLDFSDIMLLIQSLPNLIEIQSRILEPFTIKGGLELQAYLRKTNRQLRINSVNIR